MHVNVAFGHLSYNVSGLQFSKKTPASAAHTYFLASTHFFYVRPTDPPAPPAPPDKRAARARACSRHNASLSVSPTSRSHVFRSTRSTTYPAISSAGGAVMRIRETDVKSKN